MNVSLNFGGRRPLRDDRSAQVSVTACGQRFVPAVSLLAMTAADLSLRLELHSADLIHSFWVPELGGKRDVVPGSNHLCGAGAGRMTPDNARSSAASHTPTCASRSL